MSFRSWLFGKKTIRKDEVFGEIILNIRKLYLYYFLNESLFFTPTGQEICCSIETGPEGPVENQRIFYQKILEDYGQLAGKIQPLIEVELSAFQGQSQIIRIKDFKRECQLVAIDIPQIGSGPVWWNWSFETIHDSNHMATIYMIDGSPQAGVQFDG